MARSREQVQGIDLREKIERSLPQLSSQALVQVADLIDKLEDQKTLPSDREVRLRWLERLRQNRSRLSVPSKQQTVVEMRQEERYLAIASELQMLVVTGDVGLASSGQMLGLDVELVLADRTQVWSVGPIDV